MTDEEQKRIFSKNINYYISQSGMQQKEVAKALGFNPTTFNTWCVGKIVPSAGKVQKIADYFHIGKSDLLDEQPSRRNNNPYAITATEYVKFIKINDPELPQRIEDKLKGDEYVGNINVTRLQKYVNKLLSVTETQRMLIYNIIDEMYPSSNEEAATQNVYDSSSSTAPTLPKHLEDCRVDDDVNYSSTTSANS